MAERSKNLKLVQDANPEEKTYEVGYGKPPKATRFKKGQSGNPGGRPRGSKNKLPAPNMEKLKEIALYELYRPIRVRDGDRMVELPLIQAIIRSTGLNALKGDKRLNMSIIQLLQTIERENKASHDEYLKTVLEYKADWEQELERRKNLDIDAPDPIPHPDDIIVDLKTGMVNIRGPMTKEEKIEWDNLRKLKSIVDKLHEEHEEEVEKHPEDKKRLKNLERLKKITADYEETVGPYASRLDEKERQTRQLTDNTNRKRSKKG